MSEGCGMDGATSNDEKRVLHAFSDADWVGDPTDHRSTTGFCFFLGNSLISWHSKKQTLVAHSSTRVEYRALADTTQEFVWLHWLLSDMGVSHSAATNLYCDNQSAIQIAHNNVAMFVFSLLPLLIRLLTSLYHSSSSRTLL